MKTLHLLIIVIFSASLGIANHRVFADDTNNVEIQDIQVQPSTIKVGDAIKIIATLVNNSPDPVYVSNQGSHDCEGAFFTVMFDNHIKINETGIACSYVALGEQLDSGKKYTGTSPDIGLVYIATKAGTANATVTFPYEVRNQTDPSQSGIWKTISKSFLFTINDNSTLNGITGITFGSSTPSFIIKDGSPLQQSLHGTAPKDVKCNDGFQLIFKAEDGSPACVKPDTANKFVARGWGIIAVYPNSNPVTNIPYQGIDKPSGIVLIENQTYHMTTFNGTFDSIPSNGTNISFHNVLFTLLKPQQSNGNGDLFTVDAKFMNDNAAESLVIYPVGVGATQSDKAFSNHTNPQAGFVVYNSTIKLLVSTDADSNTQTGMLDSSSPLKLYLSTSSQMIHPGQAIGITISINNTLSKPITLSDENSWKLGDLSVNPCMSAPYGIAILNGFYSEQNVTEGKPLGIFSNDALCPVYNKTSQNYVFQPSSGHVTGNDCTNTECSTGFDMGKQFTFSGIWNHGQIQPFSPGLYTVVGGDEWSHVAIEHFVVSNSTIFAGNLGSMSCPLMYGGVQFGATIKNSTGFANYYNSIQYGYTFFLHPGMQGTTSVQYKSPADAAWFENNGNAPLNMTSGAVLFYMENVTEGKSIVSYAVSLYNDETGHHSQICHYNLSSGGGFMEPCDSDNTGDIVSGELPFASNVLHVGIDTSVKPDFVMLSPNTSPVFTGTVSTQSDAMPGVYWLSLERSLCDHGVLAKLVVLP